MLLPATSGPDRLCRQHSACCCTQAGACRPARPSSARRASDKLQLTANVYRQQRQPRPAYKHAWNDSTMQTVTAPRFRESHKAQTKCVCPLCHSMTSCNKVHKRRGASKETEATVEQLEVLSLLQASTDCWSPEGWLQPRQACRPHTEQSETRCHINTGIKSASASLGLQQPCLTLALELPDRHHSPARPPVSPDAVLSLDPQSLCHSLPGQSVCCNSQTLSAEQLSPTALNRAVASPPDTAAATVSHEFQPHTACRQLFPACESPRTCSTDKLSSVRADRSVHADSSPVSPASCSTSQPHQTTSADTPHATGSCAIDSHMTAAPPIQQLLTVMPPAKSAVSTPNQQQQCVSNPWSAADTSTSDWGEVSAVQLAGGVLETGVGAEPKQQQHGRGSRSWVPADMPCSQQIEGSRVHPAGDALGTGLAAAPALQQQHISRLSSPAAVPSIHQPEAAGLQWQQRSKVVAKPATDQQHQALSMQHTDNLELQLVAWPSVDQQSQLPQSAAAMAAWLLQQPKLLESVLDQLEVVAASQGRAMLTPSAQVPDPANQPQAQPQYHAAAMQQSTQGRQQNPGTGNHVQPLVSAISVMSTTDGVATDAQTPSSSLQGDVAVMQDNKQQPCSNADSMKLQHPDGYTGKADAASTATSSQPMQQSLLDGCVLGQQLLEQSQAGRYDEARQLVRQGASLNSTDQQGNTALMLACQQGHGRLVKLLVRKGANIQAQNARGFTAEQQAHASMHNSIVKYLTASTADQAAA